MWRTYDSQRNEIRRQYMKWFSIRGIFTEMKRIRWPKGKDLGRNSMTVFLFVFLLGVFFYATQVISSAFLRLIGMV